MQTFRDDLIERARQYGDANEAILDIAQKATSTVALNSLERELGAPRPLERVSDYGFVVALLICFVVSFEFTDAKSWYWPLIFIGIGLLGCTMITSLGIRANRRNEVAQLLTTLAPIKGSDDCLTAADYVREAVPAVVTWRNIALAERGQLHVFDIEVMRCLHNQAREAAKAIAHQQEMEASWCIAHGVTSAAPANSSANEGAPA